MRSYLVAGNWKMNGSTDATARLLDGILAGMNDLSSVEMLVCPAFPYLAGAARIAKGSALALGAQNLSEHESGAFTGEVSGTMLRDVGCKYVLVGHSERRALLGESSVTVAAKFQAALKSGLLPILCVGETLQEREADETANVIDEQLNAVFEVAGMDVFGAAVIAYEPVWAIGTGVTATPEQAQEVHAHIRQALASRSAEAAARTRILYGGSVKGDNAAGLFSKPDLDGGLIGGAALKSADFLAIAVAAASLG
jgi:triosephosphate isomerase